MSEVGRAELGVLAVVYALLVAALARLLPGEPVVIAFTAVVMAYGSATLVFGGWWRRALTSLPFATVVAAFLHFRYGETDCWPTCSAFTQVTGMLLVLLVLPMVVITLFALVLGWPRWRGP